MPDVVVIGGGIAGVSVAYELAADRRVTCRRSRPAWLALERVEVVTGLGLRSVQSSWAGLRSFVADRAPVIGAWPQHPGFHFFAGQGGSGIESAPALAALGAAIVIGDSLPPDIPLNAAALAPARLA